MSDANAISAVTSLLSQLLLARLQAIDPSTQVTTKPLDKARDATHTPSQLNVFLYQTTISAAYRNQDPPQVRPGEAGFPALPLELHYLLTAFGAADDDVDAHKVLGRALSVLHDTPLLNRTGPIAQAVGLDQQHENLRVTPTNMTLEELSKMWTAFQTQYRASAAFCVSLVLIDSTRPTRSALPVLTRGSGDRGVATVVGGVPELTGVRPAPFMPAAELGSALTLLGDRLDQSNMVARFRNFRLENAIEIAAPPSATGAELRFTLPTFPATATAFDDWAPGLYSVGLIVGLPDVANQPQRASNEVAFALAPTISVVQNATQGSVAVGSQLDVTCTPHVRPEQRVVLVFGEQQLTPSASTLLVALGDPSRFSFVVPDLPSGDYPVRLRVDGVDSNLVNAAPSPGFDPSRRVRIA